MVRIVRLVCDEMLLENKFMIGQSGGKNSYSAFVGRWIFSMQSCSLHGSQILQVCLYIFALFRKPKQFTLSMCFFLLLCTVPFGMINMHYSFSKFLFGTIFFFIKPLSEGFTRNLKTVTGGFQSFISSFCSWGYIISFYQFFDYTSFFLLSPHVCFCNMCTFKRQKVCSPTVCH